MERTHPNKLIELGHQLARGENLSQLETWKADTEAKLRDEELAAPTRRILSSLFERIKTRTNHVSAA